MASGAQRTHATWRSPRSACRWRWPSVSSKYRSSNAITAAYRLSAVGAAIVEQARRVLGAARELRELARQSSDPFRGTLRLGVIPTIGPYLLPEAITPQLSKTFPHLQLLWTEARTGDLVQELKDGRLDGVLLALEADVSDLDHEVIARDPFVLAASLNHLLVKSSKPTPAEILKDQMVLLPDDGHCFRDQALSFCTQASAGEHTFRATSLATLVQMVSAGTAVTLLPSLALPVENRRGQLRVRRFTTPEPGRTIALAWRRGSALRQPLITVGQTMRGDIGRKGSAGSRTQILTRIIPRHETRISRFIHLTGRGSRGFITSSLRNAHCADSL